MAAGAATQHRALEHESSDDVGFSDAQIDRAPSGQYRQLSDLASRLETAFSEVSPGGEILIEGHEYILSRSLGSNCAWNSSKDWAYCLARKNGDGAIKVYFQHHTPSNYETTQFFEYNGTIRTGDKEIVSKVVRALASYFDKRLPL